MSSAICLNLDQSKILLSSNGLNIICIYDFLCLQGYNKPITSMAAALHQHKLFTGGSDALIYILLICE